MKQPSSWAKRIWGYTKLKTKLFIAFAILSLVPLIVVGTYACRYMHASIVERVEDNIAQSIQQFEASISYRLQRYEQVMRYLTLNDQVSTIFHTSHTSYYDIYYNMEKIYSPLLLSICDMNRDIAAMGIYTSNDSLRPRGTDVLALDMIADHPLAVKALQDYDIHWDVEGDMLLAMSRVLKLTKKAPDNIAYMRIPLAPLLASYPSRVDTYGLALFDEDRLLASQIQGEIPSEMHTWLQIQEKTAFIDGQRMLIIRQPIAQNGWQLVFCCPYAELDIDLSHLIWFICIALLLCLATMMIVSWRVANDVVRRIKALNHSMTLVEYGDLQQMPDAWETDEIGDLTRHFGTMLSALNRHIETDYNNQLLLRDAEIKMLQAQINPHFLYNILSMINWMALEKDEIEISEVLMQFSKFYRMILNRGSAEVRVRDEIDHISCYLDLQLRLHENSFDAVIDVDPEMMEYSMIGVVLQPIAENAIQHGIDVLRDRRGRLSIRGEHRGNELIFTVSDNGPGMSREQFEENLSRSSKGYGLKNVNDRLNIAYGSPYGLSMDEEYSSGACIRVRIPAQSTSQ